MLKALLFIAFLALTLLVSPPASAADEVCLDRQGIETVAELASAAACSSDYDCSYGNICEYSQCRPAQCWSDNQCFGWEMCTNGRCERDPWATSCRVDADCFGARYCRMGYCKRW